MINWWNKRFMRIPILNLIFAGACFALGGIGYALELAGIVEGFQISCFVFAGLGMGLLLRRWPIGNGFQRYMGGLIFTLSLLVLIFDIPYTSFFGLGIGLGVILMSNLLPYR